MVATVAGLARAVMVVGWEVVVKEVGWAVAETVAG